MFDLCRAQRKHVPQRGRVREQQPERAWAAVTDALLVVQRHSLPHRVWEGLCQSPHTPPSPRHAPVCTYRRTTAMSFEIGKWCLQEEWELGTGLILVLSQVFLINLHLRTHLKTVGPQHVALVGCIIIFCPARWPSDARWCYAVGIYSF